MVKLVVFDWNGTLLADTHACMDTDNYILKVFGGRQINLKTYRDTIIIPSIEFYVQHGCKREQLLTETKKWGEEFHSHYEPRAAKVRTRQNARKLMDWLLKNKIELIILSNHTILGIESQLKRLRIEKYFSKVLANEAQDISNKSRNKKEKLEEWLHSYKLKKNEVMIVGDAPEEVEMGKSIGIKTVAITGGYYATHRLVASKPDYLINNLSQVIDIVAKSF